MNRSSRFSGPTSPEVRALAAAMRVALGSALVVACGGRLAPELETPTLAPSTGSNLPTPPPPTSAPGPGSETLKCDARLEAAFPDGGTFHNFATPLATDPALVACCDQIAATSAGVEQSAILRRSGCCHVDFAGNGAACTPWGPPVPPSMPARLA
jgi:hypothetical protein